MLKYLQMLLLTMLHVEASDAPNNIEEVMHQTGLQLLYIPLAVLVIVIPFAILSAKVRKMTRKKRVPKKKYTKKKRDTKPSRVKKSTNIILDTNIVKSFVKNQNADNRLYYFRFIFKNKNYYKLGITSQLLKQRYGQDYAKIDAILYDEKIDNALKIEKELKQRFKDDIFPLKYFNSGGHTEIFDRDILELDN